MITADHDTNEGISMTTVIGHTRNDERPGPTIIVGAEPGTVVLMGYAGEFPHFQAAPFRLPLSPADARQHAFGVLRAADMAERPCCAWHDQHSPMFNPGSTECRD
jgi:hypothetical protein